MFYILLLTSILFSQLEAQTVFFSTISPKKKSSMIESIKVKPVFFWDLHGVLFLQNKPQLLKKTFFSKKTIFNCPLQVGRAIFSRENWRKARKELKRGTLTYDAYCEIYKEYDDLYRMLIESANNLYAPNNPVLGIVKQLHDLNYENHLFSNIGPIVLSDLKNRYPLHFVWFKNHGKNLINPTKPDENKPWLAKPQPAAYVTAMKMADVEAKNIIFIDDSMDKIHEALKQGWNCILYKNHQQLWSDIQYLIKK